MSDPTLSALLNDGVVRDGFEVVAPGLPEHSDEEDLVTWDLERVRHEVAAMADRLGAVPGNGSRLNPLRASHSASIAGQKSGTPSRKHSSAWLRSAKSRREPSLTRRFSMRRQTR